SEKPPAHAHLPGDTALGRPLPGTDEPARRGGDWTAKKSIGGLQVHQRARPGGQPESVRRPGAGDHVFLHALPAAESLSSPLKEFRGSQPKAGRATQWPNQLALSFGEL